MERTCKVLSRGIEIGARDFRLRHCPGQFVLACFTLKLQVTACSDKQSYQSRRAIARGAPAASDDAMAARTTLSGAMLTTPASGRQGFKPVSSGPLLLHRCQPRSQIRAATICSARREVKLVREDALSIGDLERGLGQ